MDDHQRPAGLDLGVASQASNFLADGLNTGVVGAVVDERPAERLGVEGLGGLDIGHGDLDVVDRVVASATSPVVLMWPPHRVSIGFLVARLCVVHDPRQHPNPPEIAQAREQTTSLQPACAGRAAGSATPVSCGASSAAGNRVSCQRRHA